MHELKLEAWIWAARSRNRQGMMKCEMLRRRIAEFRGLLSLRKMHSCMDCQAGKHHVYLSLGSNLGDRAGHLHHALFQIGERVGRVLIRSGIYESAAWGYRSKNMFYNMCIKAETDLSPEEVMDHILEIEQMLGRKRSGDGYTDRPIDIDLLFYDDLVMESSELRIPHPGMAERRFVLLPLQEIAPDFIHPVLHRTVADLADACQDEGSTEPVTG